MTVQEALTNIDIVAANARMNRQEHDSLKESITLIAQRCNLADKLEKEKQECDAAKKEVKEDG